MAGFTDMVDRMLVESDKDKDGYISYAEYVGARRWFPPVVAPVTARWRQWPGRAKKTNKHRPHPA